MQNTAKASWLPVFFDHIQTIEPGLAAMNDNRQLGLLRERHLVAENAVLHIARRMIIEIIETKLSPGDDLGMLRQPGQFLQMLWRDFLRFVRMYTDGGVNPIMLFSKRQRGIQLLGSRPGADGEQCRHTSRTRAIEHGFTVFRELREVDVRVRVN